jgi:ABC-type Mn2+/Zn2+ transport system ATPase subunit
MQLTTSVALDKFGTPVQLILKMERISMSGYRIEQDGNTTAPRLLRFRIEGLFEEFDYTIPLKQVERVTAIIAPNGAGKTVCLRMIGALFSRKWSIFTTYAYREVSYWFSNGAEIRITQTHPKEEAPARTAFILKMTTAGAGEAIEWKPDPADSRRAPPVERYLPFLSRLSTNEWRHDHSGRVYDWQELIETYEAELPRSFTERFYKKLPEPISTLIDQIDCRLIETQRLLVLREQEALPYYAASRPTPSQLAISQKANELKEIISKQLSNYATLSQSLDRSFPRRVISSPALLSPSELKLRLTALDEKRLELMVAGILDTEADDPVVLPEGPFEDAIARVLSVYAVDTERKLASLSDLLGKIKLFKKIIDDRFGSKDVRITKQNGIEVSYHDRKVPIESLSSGEQHQLVLFFALLFEIKQNSLILIDEPELSLHVAWQKKFIGDLMEIIELTGFDVVLATHSPQLTGRWTKLVVELGEVDETSILQPVSGNWRVQR